MPYVSIRRVAREVAANLAMQIPAVRKWRVTRGRTTLYPLETQADFAVEQFQFFRDNLGAERLRDAVIVEIGPGDSVPLAGLFLAAGARRYVAVDRFLGNIYSPKAQVLYAAVAKRAPTVLDEGRIGLIRHAIEDTRIDLDADICVSFDVVEHLKNPRAAFQRIAHLLRPGGITLHRIDYGPHEYWPRRDRPMDFLDVPEAVWRLMGSARGFPNRVGHAGIVRAVEDAGLSVATRVTQFFPNTNIPWDAEVLGQKGFDRPIFRGGMFRGGRLQGSH